MLHNIQKGFTLVELLIVIAVVGVLAAMLVPNLLSARDRAYDAAAQACAKGLLTQGAIFRIDNNTYENFDGTGSYKERSCGEPGTDFEVVTADAAALAGTVTSKSGVVFNFSDATGVTR